MLRRVILPLIAALLAVASAWWLSEQETKTPAPDLAIEKESPDAFMEGVVSRAMDALGRPRYEMHAARVTHYARGDRSEFDTPFVTFYRADGRLWTLAAEQGSATGGDENILLHGEVLLRRPHRPGGDTELEVRTRDLSIRPDQEYAETDQPATLIHPYGRVQAVGLRAWFRQERLQLLSQVNGSYEP